MVKKIGALVVIALVIILLGVAIWRSCDVTWNRYEIKATVTDKVVKNSEDDSTYLVFTEDTDGEIHVFMIEDNFWAGRFDSSNDYGGIKVGNTYQFTVGGTRFEFFSWYPNIYEYVLLENKDDKKAE